MPERMLSDEDVQAIADALEERMMARIDEGLGRGLRGYLSKLVLWGILALTAYGWVKGVRP